MDTIINVIDFSFKENDYSNYFKNLKTIKKNTYDNKYAIKLLSQSKEKTDKKIYQNTDIIDLIKPSEIRFSVLFLIIVMPVLSFFGVFPSADSLTGGLVFDEIKLDKYINDLDNSDAEISWTYVGNSDLTVNIENRVAEIRHPIIDFISGLNY